MSELKNIENSQEVETIPTDNTTNDLQENVEQSTSDNEVIDVPEDISADSLVSAIFFPCQGNV